MNRQKPSRERGDEQPKKTESPKRAAAPPIEREHETGAGIFEEDERHEEQDGPRERDGK
jgi:hypothetical protein